MQSNAHLGLNSLHKNAPKLVQLLRSLRVVTPFLQCFHYLFGVHCLSDATGSLFGQNEPFTCPDISLHLSAVLRMADRHRHGSGSLLSRRCSMPFRFVLLACSASALPLPSTVVPGLLVVSFLSLLFSSRSSSFCFSSQPEHNEYLTSDFAYFSVMSEMASLYVVIHLSANHSTSVSQADIYMFRL